MTIAFSPSEIGRGMKAVPNQSHLGPREKNAIQLSRFNGLYHMTEATAMTKSIQEQTPDAPVVDHIWVAPTSEGPETVLFLNHEHFGDIQISIKRDQRVLQNRTIARQLLSKVTDQVAGSEGEPILIHIPALHPHTPGTDTDMPHPYILLGPAAQSLIVQLTERLT